MKKSLIVFAFIFLLSVSVVSAGFFDWLTGDATSTTSTGPSLVRTTSVADGGEGGTSSTSVAGGVSSVTLRRGVINHFVLADGTSSEVILGRDSVAVDDVRYKIDEDGVVQTPKGKITVTRDLGRGFFGARTKTTIRMVSTGLLNPECKKVEEKLCKDDSECLFNKKFIGSTCGVEGKCKCIGIRGCPSGTGGLTPVGGDIAVITP